MNQHDLQELLARIRACRHCEEDLPLGANPVLRVGKGARVLIVGQAPGVRVHESSIPWNDPSGERLRAWLEMSKGVFYDESKVAIVPMGFCYPGRGRSGDLPPRKECEELWKEPLREFLEPVPLTLLIGQYAQASYLKNKRKKNLTETVRCFREYLPQYFPLPHPSPRNTLWLKKNSWFEVVVLPALRREIFLVLENQK